MRFLPTTPLITDPTLIFFVVLVIILATPIVLRRFKIPHLVGLIVIGVAIGPFGFNLIARDSSFEIFGQVGLLYLMALAGLEIDLFHLQRNLNRGIGFGLLTFFIPLLLGYVTSVWLLHLNWMAASLIAAIYAAHTLISYPIVAKFQLTKRPAVLIAIVGTIVAIIGSLMVLAIVEEVSHEGEFSPLALIKLIGLMILYGAALLYIYPRATRWFFKSFSDGISQFVYVLMMVFLAAAAAKLIGMEPVLGAFVAGLVLNRFIPSRSPLMNRIEFVGNALFIPYFLIGVGMLINVRVLGNASTLYITSIMLVMAVLSKWIAAAIAQRVYKMRPPERNLLFGLSTAHTAVAIAVAMIGYTLVMPDGTPALGVDVLNATVLMILFTCTIAPIVTERASARELKHIQQTHGIEPSESRQSSDNALVAVANEVNAHSTTLLAMMMNGKDRITPLSAICVRTDDDKRTGEKATQVLNIASSTAAAAGYSISVIDRFDVNAVVGINNAVKERHITEIYTGSHHRQSFVSSFFGATLEQLVNNNEQMVVINRSITSLNTITRIYVVVPPNAEFESGFTLWVEKVANFTKQVGCRIVFHAHADSIPYLKGALVAAKAELRAEFQPMEQWSDYIMLSGSLTADDLLFMVCARRSSMSFNKEMDNMPGIINRYFAPFNIIFIYPQQTDTGGQRISFAEPVLNDISVPPTGIWLAMLRLGSSLNRHKKNLIASLRHHFRT